VPVHTFLRSGLAAVLALALLGVEPAAAAQDPRLKKVEAQVADLESKAESAAEDWNAARMKLRASELRVAALKRKASTERAAFNAVAKDLGRLVAAMYKSGMIDLDVQALFADDPTKFLAQMSAVQQIGSNQAVTLKRIQSRRLSLVQAEAAVKAEEAIAKALASEAAVHKKAADLALAKASKILAGLQAAERKRLAEIQAAQRAADARRAAEASASLNASLAKVSARLRTVIKYALAQVGDRYRMGATGPSAFDCSGLVLSSYRQIGISLPHYSRAQYSATRRVSRGSLLPGDLVFFFGRGIKHVGIYIGSDRFVHASNPRYGVRVTSLSEPYYLMRISGYGRVVR
jgi:cell wall-associated NlpC family hydrolase